MQKWEYCGCRVWDGFIISSNIAGKVEQFAELTHNKSDVQYQLLGQQIAMTDYFNKLGAEDWELVALAPTETTGTAWRTVSMRAVL